MGGRVYVSFNYREPEVPRPRRWHRILARLVGALLASALLVTLALVLGVATSCSVLLH